MTNKATKFKTITEFTNVDDMSNTKLIQHSSTNAFEKSKIEIVMKCKENLSNSLDKNLKKTLYETTDKGTIYNFCNNVKLFLNIRLKKLSIDF